MGRRRGKLSSGQLTKHAQTTRSHRAWEAGNTAARPQTVDEMLRLLPARVTRDDSGRTRDECTASGARGAVLHENATYKARVERLLGRAAGPPAPASWVEGEVFAKQWRDAAAADRRNTHMLGSIGVPSLGHLAASALGENMALRRQGLFATVIEYVPRQHQAALVVAACRQSDVPADVWATVGRIREFSTILDLSETTATHRDLATAFFFYRRDISHAAWSSHDNGSNGEEDHVKRDKNADIIRAKMDSLLSQSSLVQQQQQQQKSRRLKKQSASDFASQCDCREGTLRGIEKEEEEEQEEEDESLPACWDDAPDIETQSPRRCATRWQRQTTTLPPGYSLARLATLDLTACTGLKGGGRFISLVSDAFPLLRRLLCAGCFVGKDGPETLKALLISGHASLLSADFSYSPFISEAELPAISRTTCPKLIKLRLVGCPLLPAPASSFRIATTDGSRRTAAASAQTIQIVVRKQQAPDMAAAALVPPSSAAPS